MQYKIKLPAGSMVLNKLVISDHWVTVKANSEWEAKTKACHKIAQQMLYGDRKGARSEPCFVFSNYGVKQIRNDIDLADLEVYQ